MEKTYKPLLVDSVKAQTDLDKQRFIGFDGNYCLAGAKALGVSDAETEKNQLCPVAVNGILLIKAGGAILQGAKVQSDNNGYAVTYTSGEVNGYALDESTGAGEIIRIARGV
jgi:hypothetical protein